MQVMKALLMILGRRAHLHTGTTFLHPKKDSPFEYRMSFSRTGLGDDRPVLISSLLNTAAALFQLVLQKKNDGNPSSAAMMNRNKDISDNEEGGQSGEEEETLPQHHQDEEEHQQIYSFLPTAQRSQYSSVTTASTLLRQQSVSSATRSSNLSDPEQLFPNKLFHMLHDAERQGFTQIVSWGKDSPRAFRVHKKREFESLVLPKYFKMTKYKSFTRQLHNYEFLWVRSGNDKGGCKKLVTSAG
jgi:hypothetical protein